MAEIDRIERLIERLRDHYRTDIGMASETSDDIADAAAAIRLLLDELSRLRGEKEEAQEALRVIATGSGYEWSETREQLQRIIDAAVECASNALAPTRQKGEAG